MEVQVKPAKPNQNQYEQAVVEKRRGVALRYAVDLVINGKIRMDEVYSYADDFAKYLAGELK